MSDQMIGHLITLGLSAVLVYFFYRDIARDARERRARMAEAERKWAEADRKWAERQARWAAEEARWAARDAAAAEVAAAAEDAEADAEEAQAAALLQWAVDPAAAARGTPADLAALRLALAERGVGVVVDAADGRVRVVLVAA